MILKLHHHHLMKPSEGPHPDRRKFEAELPNDIWQSDCMHGPRILVDGKERKAYLFAFLDDMSRLICHAEFFCNERVENYIAALRAALAKRGLPRKLYVDNGPAFRSHLLAHATASLGIALIHSTPYQPQGRGKIERFFRTLRMQFLSTCPEGLPLEKLNEALNRWIDDYNGAVHSQLENKELKWEKNTNVNIGLEFGIFNRKREGFFYGLAWPCSCLLCSERH